MSDDATSLIGFDPLAWMKEDEEEAAAAAPEPVASSPAAAAPATTGAPVGSGDAFRLAESLDITTVGQVYEELSQLLEQHHDLTLDGAAVERVDTAALQLLAAFARELRGRSIALHWQAPSAVLRRGALLLGLGGELGLR